MLFNVLKSYLMQPFQGFGMDVDAVTSEEETAPPASPSEEEEEDEGPYAFRRKAGCIYQSVSNKSEISRARIKIKLVLPIITFEMPILCFSLKKTLRGPGVKRMKTALEINVLDTFQLHYPAKMATNLLDFQDVAWVEEAGE